MTIADNIDYEFDAFVVLVMIFVVVANYYCFVQRVEIVIFYSIILFIWYFKTPLRAFMCNCFHTALSIIWTRIAKKITALLYVTN